MDAYRRTTSSGSSSSMRAFVLLICFTALPKTHAWLSTSLLPHQPRLHCRHQYHQRSTTTLLYDTSSRSSTATSSTAASSDSSSSSKKGKENNNSADGDAAAAPADERYYAYVEVPLPTHAQQFSSKISTNRRGRSITLTRYLDQAVQENPNLQELASLVLAIQMACKTISNLVNRAGLVQEADNDENEKEEEEQGKTTVAAGTISSSTYTDGRYYSMQRLDQLSTAVLKNALKYTGKCAVRLPPRDDDIAHHQPGVLLAKSLDSELVACLDPLDGSGNADASICTGTLFGVFETSDASDAEASFVKKNIKADDNGNDDDNWMAQVLQPAQNMKAAGYCLYSSATVLVFTLGNTVQGFTLDPQMQEFVLTHRDLTIPKRGNVYSCNEANRRGWDQGLRNYIETIQAGHGQSQQRYALRYVGSMVGDIHRTLLYGGLFLYPADDIAHPHGNLQLLYKTAPMAFIVHAAGGKALDEEGNNLLLKCPERVHMKSPCFFGSPDDMDELLSYLKK